MNDMLNGKKMPGVKTIAKFAKLYGDEIYEAAGLPALQSDAASPFDALPPDMARALELATAEVNRTLEQRSLTGSSPEAERITIEIFEKFGFKYVRTEEVEEE